MFLIKSRIIRLFNIISNTTYRVFHKSENVIVVNACMTLYGNNVRHINLGDDLNYYLIKELTFKHILNYRDFWHTSTDNVLCIGSIIEDFVNENSIIWGSGAMYGGDAPLKAIPKKVLAVRGPLTRDYLLSKGVDCPEVYGDPALLLSKIYNPAIKKKYKYGVIPHWIDLNNEYVQEFVARDRVNICLIDLKHYDDWRIVIDRINECEFIISSSLHGIIISDSYNIPNVWVEFSDNVIGNGFKFRDYFASIKRNVVMPLKISSYIDIETLKCYKTDWKPISIDLNKLISVSPFVINF